MTPNRIYKQSDSRDFCLMLNSEQSRAQSTNPSQSRRARNERRAWLTRDLDALHRSTK